MPKQFVMLIIGLFFGTGVGFLLATANDATLSGHDHGAHEASHVDHSDNDGHNHSDLLDMPANLPTPEVTVQLTPDGPTSWNLHLLVRNFRFAPESANFEHVPGEGHAHLYIDGVKRGRIYGPWFHLSDVPKGAREIRVTLNANSHETLALDGVAIDTRVSLAD